MQALKLYVNIQNLKTFQFKVMYSMDYASNSSRTYTPVINV